MFRIVERAAAALSGAMNEIQALRSLSLLTTLALVTLTLAVSALF